jgi:hypothetical protein
MARWLQVLKVLNNSKAVQRLAHLRFSTPNRSKDEGQQAEWELHACRESRRPRNACLFCHGSLYSAESTVNRLIGEGACLARSGAAT